MQRWEVLRRHAFEKSCSRVTFSNTWGATVFVVLHLGRSGALFFDSSWPSVSSLEVQLFRSGALVRYFPVCGAFLSSLLGVVLGCLLGRRVRSGPVDGSRFSTKAFPCSAALAFLKKKRSHAAWRSFCVLRHARHPLAAGLGGTYAKALPCSVALIFLKKSRSHAAWRSKCSASLRRPRAPILVFPIYFAPSFLSC